jgi:hypothetical protein
MVVQAGAADASTIPVLDPGRVTLAGGLADIGVDYRLDDRWQLGASAAVNLSPAVAVRSTYRHTEGVGLVLSTGVSSNFMLGVRVPPGMPVPNWFSAWVQPALEVAVPIPQTPLTLRATMGPRLDYAFLNDTTWNLHQPWSVAMVPNAELGLQLPWGELTLGGNALAGWRARW